MYECVYMLVGECGVVPLQLLLSAGTLLVLWLSGLLILAALRLSTCDVIFLLTFLALLLFFFLLLTAVLVLISLPEVRGRERGSVFHTLLSDYEKDLKEVEEPDQQLRRL
jgi:prepilin signal peptidase PulO-like enzyme (type II secretory pathway)